MSAALSLSKAACQAAFCAPIPEPPNTVGMWFAASHTLAMIMRARIQIRTIVGKSPIGLRPPLFLGSNTINTRLTICAHCPLRSNIKKMATSALRAASDSLPYALGATLSAPSAVLIGNVPAASDRAIGIRGRKCSSGGGPIEHSYCTVSCQRLPQLFASCSTVAWSARTAISASPSSLGGAMNGSSSAHIVTSSSGSSGTQSLR